MTGSAPGEALVRSPTRTGSVTALVAGVVVVGATALVGSPAGTALGAVGLLGVGAGLRRAHRVMVEAGALALLTGVVVGATAGGGVLPPAVGAVAVVVARGGALDALVRGRQIGAAASGSVEGRRAARLTAVAGVAGVITLGVAVVVGAGLPTVVLLALLVGPVVIVLALR